MPGTFNTSDFDEDELDEDYDDEDYDDEYGYEDEDEYDDEDDGLGEDIGDGYGEELEDPLEYEDDPFADKQKSRKGEKKKSKKGKKQEKNSKAKKLTVKGKTKEKFNGARAKKDAVAKIMSPAVEGICPFCHKRSIHKSYRPMDLLIFTGISALLTAGGGRISTFYCMNRKCKYSYWKNYCFRCGGDRWVGAKAPWKRIAGVDM